MPDQLPTIPELGQKFGAQLGLAYAEIIILERRLMEQSLTIQSMTDRETKSQDRIHSLKEQLHQLQCDVLAEQR